MGRYVAKIGKYYAEYGDYQWDYIKQRQKKEYYDDKFIDVDVSPDSDGNEYSVKIPVLDIIDLELVKTNYQYSIKDDWNLNKWLFGHLKETIPDIKILCIVYVSNFHHINSKEFYLSSEIFKSPITLYGGLTIHHRIEKWEEIQWCIDNGLTIKWVNN